MKGILQNQRIQKRTKSALPQRNSGSDLRAGRNFSGIEARYNKTTRGCGKAAAAGVLIKSHALHVLLSLVLLGLVLFVIFLPKPYKIPGNATEKEQAADEAVSLTPEESPAHEGSVSPSIEGGAGLLDVERVKDFEYNVLPGETLSEIAYVFGIEQGLLISYNHITQPDTIRSGQKIIIPSQDNLQNLEEIMQRAALRSTETKKEQTPAPDLSHLSKLPKTVDISVTKQNDGTSITAHFSVLTEIDDSQVSYVWDLGNGHKAFRKETAWTYTSPGTYPVKLTVSDRYGVQTNSPVLFIDVPHPDVFQSMNREFLTLAGVGAYLTVQGKITQVSVHGVPTDSFPFEVVSEDGQSTTYKTLSAGYYDVIAGDAARESQIYLFVSPLDSIHSDRRDLNWYRTQFNTGTPSNCGPAVVSMGIGWALGQYIPVSKIREQIGWKGNGSTSFPELLVMLQRNNVLSEYRQTGSPADIFDIIDNDHIAIILYSSGAVSWTKGNPAVNLFGRYYNDSVGHYIIIKGYTQDKKYFVVYDPIPSDWGSNSLRYGDGVSMIGRNRYYPVSEVYNALRRFDVIEIMH